MKKSTRPLRKKRKKKAATGASKLRVKKEVWLNVLPADRWIKVKPGITVYEALENTDLEIEGDCGGVGTCGKCKIRVITALKSPSQQEKALLTKEELANGERLACRTRITKNLVVYTEPKPGEMELFQILKHGQTPEVALDPLLNRYTVSVEPPSLESPDSDFCRLRDAIGSDHNDLKVSWGCLASLYKDLRKTGFKGQAIVHQNCLLAWTEENSNKGRFGIVFDIGTTTLVGKLVDITNGREVSVVSRLNSQSRYGSDVISRIKFVRERKNGLKRMRELLLRDINTIIRRLLRVNRLKSVDIFVAVAAGNTTMQHFLLGLDPSGIAEAPFSPVITEGVTFRTQDLGLDLHPDAMLYVMPCKTGYIGGDLISFILASNAFEEEEKMILGLDFGTNGEIFLGNRHRILTCSTAAGPALEGARISRGMIARAGAIEGVRMEDDELRLNIIGNIKSKGLCGSGLVDLVAVLLHNGVIDNEGLLGPDHIRASGAAFRQRVLTDKSNDVSSFVVASARQADNHKKILLTQKDVRELQLAKGAVAAGVQLLMQEMNVGLKDIDMVYLAGALGNYVNPLSAMRIGLIPMVPVEKILSLGNAASAGAKMALLSKAHWEKAADIAGHLEHMELSVMPVFYENFIQAMDFPDTNLW